MHRVLARQLARLGLALPDQLPTAEQWRQFLERVDRFYTEADQDRYLMERSQEISSGEMLELYDRLHEAQRIAQLGNWSYEATRGERRCSEECLRLMGLAATCPVPGYRSLLRRVHPEDRSALSALVRGAMRDARQFKIEMRLQRLDGEWRWVRVLGQPVRAPGGRVSRLHGTLMDINAEKRAQESLAAAKDAAEAASRAKSVFLATMSHELRTPLNAILGYAQMLRRDPRLDDRQRRGLATIEESGEHLLMLINDVLDLSKIEASKLELYPVTVRLPEFLRVIADIVRVKAQERGLAFECELPPDLPPTVAVDDKRLRQVLLNLLGNAVKFTDRGKVSLEAHALGAGEGAGAVRLRLVVRDTGIGMDVAQLAGLFRPFEQVGDVQRRAGGSGLGLSISRQLVRLMGSELGVASEPGKGSLFWFEISAPRVHVEAAGPPAARVFTGYLGRRRKVLIVDDVAANRTMLADLLDSLGFATCQAGDGAQGVAQAQRWRPDLIIMDIMMPSLDGLAATRRIRQAPGLEQVPVLVLSASVAPGDAATSLAAGANAFLPKPIQQEALLRALGSCLDLAWVSEPPRANPPAPQEPGDLVAPPLDQLDILVDLARVGNMQDVRRHAERIAALDERYRPFAERLRQLSTSFQSQAITALVQSCRERAAGGPTAAAR